MLATKEQGSRLKTNLSVLELISSDWQTPIDRSVPSHCVLTTIDTLSRRRYYHRVRMTYNPPITDSHCQQWPSIYQSQSYAALHARSLYETASQHYITSHNAFSVSHRNANVCKRISSSFVQFCCCQYAITPLTVTASHSSRNMGDKEGEVE